MTNCPNCGAPIVSSKCEYCWTVFEDGAKLKTDFLKAKTQALADTERMKTLYMDALMRMQELAANDARKACGLYPIKRS